MDSAKAPNVTGVDTPGRRVVYSICGMCTVRCPIQVEVEDGRVVWIQGNPNDKTMGTSLCAKGVAGVGLVYDDQRPQQPMIRTGPRGSGQWRAVSWDEALEYVAGKLKEVIEEFGPEGVALSDRGGPFTDLTKSFLKAIGSPNYFNHDCTCARNVHHAAQSLFGWGRKGFNYDIKNSRHIVLYGRNLVESLQVKELKDFMSALKNGAKCTYIDVRATMTAAKATRFWMIRPNTEYALNLAMIHVVLKEELYDKAFVEKWVDGLEELRKFVEPYTPQWAEEKTGVKAGEIVEMIREVAADAPHVFFHPGWMLARHRQSFYTSRTAYILNVLFGAIEVPGGLVIAKSSKDAGRKGLNKIADRIPKVEAKRVDGIGWKYKHWDSGPGLMHLMYKAIETGEPYKLGAYIAYRHDPLMGLPDPEHQKRLLNKLKLIVSIDVNYSETGWFSDVILPESSYLERANILIEKKGPKPALWIRDQAIAPRFDTRPAWWIFRELARRLGVGQYFDFETIEDIWRYQLEGTGVSLEELRSKGIVALVDQPIMWDRMNGLKFKTPSGKIELVSSKLTEAGLPSFAEFYDPPKLPQGQFWLVFGRSPYHAHGHTKNNPYLNELEDTNCLWMNEDVAKAMGIADGEIVEISSGDYKVTGPVRLTRWIHPEAVFVLHGFGRSVPLQKRAYNKGIADQRLQVGKLFDYDPAGGGNCLTETVVSVRKLG